ncbi:MAG: hypothetical protein HC796_03725 [Synechococcaceae cyanobacterium RL_1_2]|nr:hypothetical protein [Synechococcaceae cyanobacterium RL_1_2]
MDQNDVVANWVDINGNTLQRWVVGSNVPTGTDAIEFDLKLGGRLFGAGIDIPIDFQFPGIALDVNGGFGMSLDWSFDFGFGLSVSDTFYLLTNNDVNDKELEVNINVFLDGNPSSEHTPATATTFNAQAQLLFFQADLTDNRPNNRPSGIYGQFSLDVVGDSRGRMTFNRLISTPFKQLFNVGFGLDADLSMKATLSLGTLNGQTIQGIPKLRGDIDVNWGWAVGQQFTNPGFGINNLEVDLGSYVQGFLSPIAQKVKDVLDPVMPIVRLLNTKIPGLDIILDDDTLKGLINLLIQLKGRNPIDFSFIDEAEQIYALVGVIASLQPGDWMPLGNIAGLGSKAGPTSTQASATGQNVGSITEIENKLYGSTSSGGAGLRKDSKTSGTKKTPRSGFQVLPYLKDISNWMNLLSGGDAILFTYELPLLEFSADFEVLLFSYGIPKIASININAIAGFAATADLSFGYDTYGIRQAINTGNPLYALDGFFIGDWTIEGLQKGEEIEKPEFTLTGYIGLEGELDIFIASIGAQGKIVLDVDIDLQDIPKSSLTKNSDGYVTNITWRGDGKIRGSEIITMLGFQDPQLTNIPSIFQALSRPLNLINIDAEIRFDLDLVGQAFGFDFRENLLSFTLFEFDWNPTPVQPYLARVENGILYLNSGPDAGRRTYGETKDGGEIFTITPISPQGESALSLITITKPKISQPTKSLPASPKLWP